MASLAFNALSLSPKPVALLPTCYKSQNYAFAVQRPALSSSARFQLNAVPRTHEVFSPKGRGFKTLRCTSAAKNENGDAEIESSAEQPCTEVVSAVPVVMDFYAAINKRDPEASSEIMSDKCLFHDSSFRKGFEGKEAVLQYIEDLIEAMGKNVLFKIDGMIEGEGDDLTVAVLWHLEWQGQKFPFSKGCGIFYFEKGGDRLLIRKVHHFTETPLKPGKLILSLLRMITSFFERFPLVTKKFLADPYYAFAGIIMCYNNYLKPIIDPLVIYYQGFLNRFLYWANYLIRIVMHILHIQLLGN